MLSIPKMLRLAEARRFRFRTAVVVHQRFLDEACASPQHLDLSQEIPVAWPAYTTSEDVEVVSGEVLMIENQTHAVSPIRARRRPALASPIRLFPRKRCQHKSARIPARPIPRCDAIGSARHPGTCVVRAVVANNNDLQVPVDLFLKRAGVTVNEQIRPVCRSLTDLGQQVALGEGSSAVLGAGSDGVKCASYRPGCLRITPTGSRLRGSPYD
jgi:hypothetical protein